MAQCVWQNYTPKHPNKQKDATAKISSSNKGQWLLNFDKEQDDHVGLTCL